VQSFYSLALSEARITIDAARAKALDIGIPMCVAVADCEGRLIAFVREDGAKPTSISIAINKAFTAAGARHDTTFYARASVPEGPAWGIDKSNDGNFTAIGGGVAVWRDGRVVGGIGVSGGTAAEDVAVAQASLQTLTVSDPAIHGEGGERR
jgi:uncharacterized protein GlcG (DUF336 family)